MRNHVVLALFALLAVLLASGCPRNPEGEDAPPAPPAPPPVSAPPVEEQPVEEVPPAEADAADTAAADAEAVDTPHAAELGSVDAVAGEAVAAIPEGGNSQAAAGTTVVVFETTKGNIEITVSHDWAPIGAEHFIKLVEAKFYDGAPWFRVLEGFVAQVGVAADPAVNQEWSGKTIQDEPVKKGNTPGSVCFGKSGMPNSRSTHIFINFGDNTTSLDPQGFACFGEVTKGMDIAQKLYRISDQAFAMSGISQMSLGGPGGLDAFRKAFPEADYVKKAYVKQ